MFADTFVHLKQFHWLRGVAWSAVISGTYIIYPWYRAQPPDAVTDLTHYPRSFLISSPESAFWHTFGMQWKQRIAWFAPFLATVVAFMVWRYGEHLASNNRLRQVLIVLFCFAFLAAGIAGLLGVLVRKAAPVF